MSSLGKTILKNTSWLFGAEALNMILTLIGGILIARSLGTITYGQYGFAFSYVALFAVLTDMGLPLLFINKVSQDKNLLKKYLANFLSLKILLGIITFLVLIIILQFLGKDPFIELIVYIVALNTIISSFTAFLHAIFRAFEKMQYEAILKVVQNTLFFLMVLYIVFTDKGLLPLVIGGLIVVVCGFFISFIFIGKKYLWPSFSFDKNFIKATLKRTLPLAASTLFITIYYSLDSVMLSEYQGDEAVGIYTAAYKLIIVLITFTNLYYGSIFPVISRLYKKNKNQLSNLLHLSVKLMLIIGIPLAIGTVIFSKDVIQIIYGQEYINAFIPLAILIWSVFIIMISIAYGNSLIACGKRKAYMYGVALGAVSNIILNFLLIPKYSVAGAGIATVASELIVFIYMYFQFNVLLKIKFYKYLFKPIIATLGMILAIYLLNNYLYFLITVLIAIIVYFSILFIIGGISKQEIKLIKQWRAQN